MRRRRHHGGRKSARRVRWLGSHVWFESEAFPHLTIATWWLKQPGDTVNLFLATEGSEPSDETLIRTLWWPVVSVNNSSVLTGTGFLTFGVIAFDSEDPVLFQAQIFAGGSSDTPDPYYSSTDWILRKQYIFPGASAPGLSTVIFYPTTDFDMQSRAMRKCPPGTGILGVLSWHSPNLGQTATLSAGVDGRIALKSGYKI